MNSTDGKTDKDNDQLNRRLEPTRIVLEMPLPEVKVNRRATTRGAFGGKKRKK